MYHVIKTKWFTFPCLSFAVLEGICIRAKTVSSCGFKMLLFRQKASENTSLVAWLAQQALLGELKWVFGGEREARDTRGKKKEK